MNAHEPATSVGFRRAGPDDASEIVALVESAYRGEPSRLGWTTEADLLEGHRTDEVAVREVIERDDSLMLLAWSGNVLVGCCQLARSAAGMAYFGMFAIRPSLQGAGLGTAVLDEAERTAREQWCARSLQMTVIRQRVELIAWYRRRGYEPTGETRPFPSGDERNGIPLRGDLEFVVLEKQIA